MIFNGGEVFTPDNTVFRYYLEEKGGNSYPKWQEKGVYLQKSVILAHFYLRKNVKCDQNTMG